MNPTKQQQAWAKNDAQKKKAAQKHETDMKSVDGIMRYPLCQLVAKWAAWLIGLGFLSFTAFFIWKIIFEVAQPQPLLTPYWYDFDQTLDEVAKSILPWQWGWWGNLLSVNGILPRQWAWWIILLFIACILAIIAAIAAWPYRKAGKKKGNG